MSKVSGLGHVGLFVKDTEVMKEFYTNFMGLTLTDKADDDFIMFFSSRPDDEHHELALLRRPDTPSSVQQVSFTVDSLADLKDFWRRIKERNLTVNMVVSHGNAFGCYFQDPESNNIEVYWKTGKDVPQPHADPINLDLSEEELLAILDATPVK